MVSDEALKKLQEQIAAWPMTQRFVVQQLIEDYSNIRKDLLAHKDTGLEPESVEALKLSMMGKAIAEIKEFNGLPVDRLRELAEADRAGRLVVLPCKVGDTIYHISKVRTSHFEDDKIIIDDEGRWKIYEMPFTLIHLPYIGKSYFLTREEAGKALKTKEGQYAAW